MYGTVVSKGRTCCQKKCINTLTVVSSATDNGSTRLLIPILADPILWYTIMKIALKCESRTIRSIFVGQNQGTFNWRLCTSS